MLSAPHQDVVRENLISANPYALISASRGLHRMSSELRIHGLDNRSLRSLMEYVKPDDGTYVVENEPAGPAKHGLPLETIIFITFTFTTMSLIAAWLASRDKEVEMEASLGLKPSFRWKIRPGKSAKQIEEELRRILETGASESPGRKRSATKKTGAAKRKVTAKPKVTAKRGGTRKTAAAQKRRTQRRPRARG
jgi:hypothetical protein